MNTIPLSLIEVMSQLPQPSERALGALHDFLLVRAADRRKVGDPVKPGTAGM